MPTATPISQMLPRSSLTVSTSTAAKDNADAVIGSADITSVLSQGCGVDVEVSEEIVFGEHFDALALAPVVTRGWINGIADLIENYRIVVDGPEPTTAAPKRDVVVVPDEYGDEPIGSGEHAWCKKWAEQPLDRFEERHAAVYEQRLVSGVVYDTPVRSDSVLLFLFEGQPVLRRGAASVAKRGSQCCEIGHESPHRYF
ncbi:hypothetical protein ACFTZB_12525 [Rhodococcus sp. NPDC057014]|uniref:hypothetical protein n=1 Tax=Rhodococcus sp. NPDC057014 TaxID=3346000 RepID=UPI003628FB51